MNKSIFNTMKRIFLNIDNRFFSWSNNIIKFKMIQLIIISILITFITGCDGCNNAGGDKNKDTVAPPNEQRVDDHDDMNTHRGMGHDNHGMDTIHREMNNTQQRRHN